MAIDARIATRHVRWILPTDAAYADDIVDVHFLKAERSGKRLAPRLLSDDHVLVRRWRRPTAGANIHYGRKRPASARRLGDAVQLSWLPWRQREQHQQHTNEYG